MSDKIIYMFASDIDGVRMAGPVEIPKSVDVKELLDDYKMLSANATKEGFIEWLKLRGIATLPEYRVFDLDIS